LTILHRKKKNGNEDKLAKAIILVTAILNLAMAVINLITKLTG